MKKEQLKSTDQLRQVSEASLIEEGGQSRIIKWSILFIAAMLVLFIIWAVLTKVDEVAVSFGDIQPVADIQVVQHLEGGIVSQVLVKNGEEVHKGEILMQFDPNAIKSELQKVQGKFVSLTLDSERLRAFIHQIPADRVDWAKKVIDSPYNTISNRAQIADLIRADRALLEQQNKERENQRAILKTKVAQKQAALQQLLGDKEETEKQLALYVKEELMFTNLVTKGYVSERDYIVVKRKANDVRAEVKHLATQIQEADSTLQEARDRLNHVDSTLDEEALKELNQIESQLLETRHNIERLTSVSKRLTLKAPVTGLVKGLKALPGTVVAPGEKLMEIVPTEGAVMVDSKINTRDIGHIRVGDPVEVKVTTFDFARYGGVRGKLEEISASTFTSEQGLPYYRARISLEQNYVGKNPQRNRLKPGMTVQADIVTGKKSIMSYLLKPITRALDTSFRER